jgi:hypothetical protein
MIWRFNALPRRKLRAEFGCSALGILGSRNLASHTQEAPACSALMRCQAVSFSNRSIVANVLSDIAQVSMLIEGSRMDFPSQ